MSDIKGIPYFEAHFDKDGEVTGPGVVIPGDTTDLFVISHGWRNSYDEATALYQEFFGRFADQTVVAPALLKNRKCAIVGVFWPSANFDFLIAGQDVVQATNTASKATPKSDAASIKKVKDRIEALKKSPLIKDAAERKILKQAQDAVKDLDTSETAQGVFVKALQSLMEPANINDEDASNIFKKMNASEVFRRLDIPPRAVDAAIPRTGRAAAVAPGKVAADTTGHAAGLLDLFKGASAAATNAVSYLSYYLMKNRAGTVGANGVAALLDRLAPSAARIHLVGHSFGGRLVTAAAKASRTDRLCSMSLLQAAFSHNGFSPETKMNGFFRAVVDGKRVKGATIATHTKNDTAVGIAYPLASRLSGTVAAAIGDENDKYGGIGRNGAQQMNPREVVDLRLGKAGSAYKYQRGKIHNVLADDFITGHGDVTGREVVTAVAAAAFGGR